MQEKGSHKSEWFSYKEVKTSFFLLKLSLYLIIILPNFIIKFITMLVVSIYYLFYKKERRAIKNFRKTLNEYYKPEGYNVSTSAFPNFYNFADMLCDKISVWKGRYNIDNIHFADYDLFYNMLSYKVEDGKPKRGSLIIACHFGNIEVLRVLSAGRSHVDINILQHSKSAAVFIEFVNQISKTRLNAFEVDKLDVATMLEVKALIDKGEHIAVMVDRLPYFDNKQVEVNFLGKPCHLSAGSYILAALLECPIRLIWCEKVDGKYSVEIEEIADRITLGRDKIASIKPYADKFIASFEKHAKAHPEQYFTFFDIWENPHGK